VIDLREKRLLVLDS